MTETPGLREVVLAPGTRVIVRMPQGTEHGGGLPALLVYVVSEPGRPSRIFDTAQTVLVVPE